MGMGIRFQKIKTVLFIYFFGVEVVARPYICSDLFLIFWVLIVVLSIFFNVLQTTQNFLIPS